MWNVMVNENMHDARAWVEEDDGFPPISGWTRVYSSHETREDAEAVLPEAKEYARSKLLP
jgi:hypothetical protein